MEGLQASHVINITVAEVQLASNKLKGVDVVTRYRLLTAVQVRWFRGFAKAELWYMILSLTSKQLLAWITYGKLTPLFGLVGHAEQL